MKSSLVIRSDLLRSRRATFSACGKYRYFLRYQLAGGDVFAPSVDPIMFLMLNPSTANELRPDPTVRRCMGFAQTMGAKELIVTNLFALRSTDRMALLSAADPVGPENDEAIASVPIGTQIICAWGEPGPQRLNEMIRERVETVREILSKHHLAALAFTKSGQPRHPLYLAANSAVQPWEHR